MLNKLTNSLILILLIFQTIESCLSFDELNRKCTMCPLGSRLYKGNCLYDIDNCDEYLQGIDCYKCQEGYKLFKKQERVQCKKLEVKKTDQYTQQQINCKLQNENHSQNGQKTQFFNSLNDYLTKKYNDQAIENKLVKILDRIYSNGRHQVDMFYKLSDIVQKSIVSVIGNYATFQVKQAKCAQKQQISPDEIVDFSEQNSQKLASKGIKTELNQKQTKSQKKPNKNGEHDENDNEQTKQISDFNYKYQNQSDRQKDIGFQTSEQFLKLTNGKILQENSKVIGCFVKNSGLRKNYRIFYRTSNRQTYEGEVIYDVVRRRAYILNFGKQLNSL